MTKNNTEVISESWKVDFIGSTPNKIDQKSVKKVNFIDIKLFINGNRTMLVNTTHILE